MTAYISNLFKNADVDGIEEIVLGLGDAVCPVCFCPPGEDNPEDDAVRLSCDRVYCKECYEGWLTGGSNCEFPLVCLADGCNRSLSQKDLNEYLGEEP
jgi:hypothetical protein